MTEANAETNNTKSSFNKDSEIAGIWLALWTDEAIFEHTEAWSNISVHRISAFYREVVDFLWQPCNCDVQATLSLQPYL